MPKLRHYDDAGSVRFVTFGTYRAGKTLRGKDTIELFLSELSAARKKHGFKLLGNVVMPDHVHLVLFPKPETRLGHLIREVKSKFARAYFARHRMTDSARTNVFWQKRCYDHNCRSRGEVRAAIEYCHRNPVRRGLVAEMRAWRWSSYNWYEGATDVPIAMDVMEL